ncbi:MAG TPA: 2-oxoglutarate dehydrogenase complex dihydrolipoyllysine-residue succinyltransferase [Pirellulales bacterium]|jgi:2-oxoglutarate dehydrogenase E2 component (dihydrolipoamide succinyltransferase)
MALELKVPPIGESITEVQIGAWLKRVGDRVRKDDSLVEIESDKATAELPAPADGVLTQVLKQRGEIAQVGEVIAYMEQQGAEGTPAPAAPAPPVAKPALAPSSAAPAASAPPAPQAAAPARESQPVAQTPTAPRPAAPTSEHAGRLAHPSTRPLHSDVVVDGAAPLAQSSAPQDAADEEIVPMSLLRVKTAERLVQAQQTQALLTTFNEIDMTAVMEFRGEFKEQFHDAFGEKLGFMSFFVKATVQALKSVPVINAEIRGNTIVYRNHYDIGIAVGGGKGLVVPVIRQAERMSFAEIEHAIADFANRAQKNQLKVEELQGGTFTISNGGTYGSLLSTPIVNPPQSGILGLHAIQDRPVARDNQVVIRPMMYVALTYDHRLIDGRAAVTFLKKVKENVEEPARMLLEM